MKYPICDYLEDNSNIHCASLVITESITQMMVGEPEAPSFYLRNGTITFVKFQDKVYGITASHVIETFREYLKISGNPQSHHMWILVNGFNMVLDRFITPKPQLMLPNIDIAIRELNPELIKKIGKVAYDLDSAIEAPSIVEHGIAIGFSEVLRKKVNIDSNGSYKLSMPHAQILAELNGIPKHRFSMYSDLTEKPEQVEYSGMSGGPVFWSTEENYGIFGIIYEGGVGGEISDGKSIYVYAEKSTKEDIIDWIAAV